MLKDISSQVDSLASCTRYIDGERDGHTLTKEIRWNTEEVIRAMKALLELFVDTFSNDKDTGSNYLAQTGIVHEAIERAKLVPSSERDAVRKRWEANLSGLDDGVKEVAQMIDDFNTEDPEELNMDSLKLTDGDDEDEDWDEFDFRPSKKSRPTEEELSRIKIVGLVSMFQSPSTNVHLSCVGSATKDTWFTKVDLRPA